ncbi:hypothetical protein [Renibacterium salmoninarum]|uniref:hypothetical protein n=1 Tax=Renibacterium salmoninarum TaxID=1646 RepID=UPI0013145D34|nr:hypothetical protein [Renibacterium salmoninarum]
MTAQSDNGDHSALNLARNFPVTNSDLAAYTSGCIFIEGLQVWHPPIVRAGGHTLCPKAAIVSSAELLGQTKDNLFATRLMHLARLMCVVYIFH